MARDLLSPKGMRRLLADVLRGPEGLDVVSVESAEPWPEATALCSEAKHEVKPGEDCPHCGVGPKCAGCPGRADT